MWLNFGSTDGTLVDSKPWFWDIKALIFDVNTLSTDIMGARNYDDWLVVGRYHELKTNTTYVGFDLLADLFGYFFIVFAGRIFYFLDQVDCVVFHSLLNFYFILDLFPREPLAPHLPLVLVFLQLILRHFQVLSSQVCNVQITFKMLQNIKVYQSLSITKSIIYLVTK